MKVVPFLVKKGSVKLAIYGIGHMKEERLNLALENQTIVFDRPLDEYEQADESYFNILVLHQNKYKGNAVGASKRNCILESAIPPWLNLVIWGHEHECIPRVVTCE
jgi:double-strand break repair protein MRE11